MTVWATGDRYRCKACFNEVAVTKVGHGTLVCCGKEMECTKDYVVAETKASGKVKGLLKGLLAFAVIFVIPVLVSWIESDRVIRPYIEWQVPGIVFLSTLWTFLSTGVSVKMGYF